MTGRMELALYRDEGTRLNLIEIGSFSVQAPLCERFARAPYPIFQRGRLWTSQIRKEDEIGYIKENLKTVNSKEVVWTIPDGTRC